MATIPKTPKGKLIKQSSTVSFNFDKPDNVHNMIHKYRSKHESRGVVHQKQTHAVEVFNKKTNSNPLAITNFPLPVQLDFRQKMYGLLCAEFLATFLFSLGFYYLSNYLLTSTLSSVYMIGISFASVIIPLMSIGLLYWKREIYPINYIFLFTFSLLKGIAIGINCVIYQNYELLILVATILLLTIIMSFVNLIVLDKGTEFERLMKTRNGAGLVWLIYTSIAFLVFHFANLEKFGLSNLALFRNFVFITVTLFWFAYDSHLLMEKVTVDEYMLGVIYIYSDIFFLLILIMLLFAASEDPSTVPVDVVPDFVSPDISTEASLEEGRNTIKT